MYVQSHSKADQFKLWPGDPHLDFAIRLHHARSVHFDIRLELDGVLLSWVIHRHPSLDPLQRVRALRMPDHDLRYIFSQRRIPVGQYGAGPRLVWDHGKYAPQASGEETDERLLRRAVRAGSIKVRLEGTKVKGLWLFEREADLWFLQKLPDEYASLDDPGWSDRSSINGISIDEVV